MDKVRCLSQNEISYEDTYGVFIPQPMLLTCIAVSLVLLGHLDIANEKMHSNLLLLHAQHKAKRSTHHTG